MQKKDDIDVNKNGARLRRCLNKNGARLRRCLASFTNRRE
jgi:hypothetical protein